jgi:hypothetical protein
VLGCAAQTAQRHVAPLYVRILDLDGSAFFYAGRVLDERFHYVEKPTIIEGADSDE